MKLPIRQSLIVQTAEAIRQGIREGLWREHLPGERQLAARLSVSRPTLRLALDVLRREGWLAPTLSGVRRRITRRPAARPGAHSVVTLLHGGFARGHSFHLLTLDEALRTILQRNNIRLAIRDYPHAAPQRLEAALRKLTREQPSAAWILARAPRPVQQWFAGQSLPVLVTGSCFPGLQLPSAGTDQRAIAAHAAGVFLRSGYRHRVMLSITSLAAGDHESEAGFRSVAATHREHGESCRILRFNGARGLLFELLDSLFATIEPPIAIFCAFPQHAVAILGYVRNLGLRVPEEVALIARDYDPILDWTVPCLTHYRLDDTLLARKLARLTSSVIAGGALPPTASRLVPDFVPGETVGKLKLEI